MFDLRSRALPNSGLFALFFPHQMVEVTLTYDPLPAATRLDNVELF